MTFFLRLRCYLILLNSLLYVSALTTQCVCLFVKPTKMIAFIRHIEIILLAAHSAPSCMLMVAMLPAACPTSQLIKSNPIKRISPYLTRIVW